jgi:hypothetical protein
MAHCYFAFHASLVLLTSRALPMLTDAQGLKKDLVIVADLEVEV